jgi:hypothetical protein
MVTTWAMATVMRQKRQGRAARAMVTAM